MNELTVNQVPQANSPVIRAGVMSLGILTTSTWFKALAVVSGVGCSKFVWSKCRNSFGSHDAGNSKSKILPGRASDLSSLSEGIERIGLFHAFKRLSLLLY